MIQETEKSDSVIQGIHVVAKPIGPACNLNCEYCFYLEKQALFDAGGHYRMPSAKTRVCAWPVLRINDFF